MSRIGRQPVTLTPGVEVTVDGGVITVKGPKGTLSRAVNARVTVTVDGGRVRVERASEAKRDKALHGTTRALIANMVEGVTKGFARKLEIHGVGYRARLQGRTLDLSVGKVKPCVYDLPEGINVDIDKNTLLTVSGIDKQMVGQVAADIRRFRPPEPYQGKGIRYADEHVRRKTGKTVG
jgi:large subunit ribosomal protein L6